MCFTVEWSVDLTIVVIVAGVSRTVFVTEERRRKHQSVGQLCLLSRRLQLKYDLNIIIIIIITHVLSALLLRR